MDIEIPDFSSAQVMVIGDIMLDRYWYGGTSRISPEAPVPVVHVKQIEERPGGAGNVAVNLTALGAACDLIGVVGNDAAAKVLTERLETANVNHSLQQMTDAPTITKLRVISRHQQLIRLDFEEALQQLDTEKLLTDVKQHLDAVGAIILSDYGKGALTCSQQIIDLARQANVPVLVDPKGHDFSLYKGASLLTPNRKEFELVVGPCHNDDELIEKGRRVLQEHQISALLVTRGEEGMTLICNDREPLHLPARAREVFDVTGAGDTVIAMLAACLASDCELEQATRLANLAASIVVGKLGAATVTERELRRVVYQQQSQQSGVLTEQDVLRARARAKALGERVVMTNGCFDILHGGHVDYLREAKALGDHLIIAVNDDDSVRQLKGPSRPINSLTRRMAMLSSLDMVDWVVPFSELTPERLIQAVKPDVLVKGGDYQADDIAGASCVKQNGGEVKILSYKEGYSTTEMITRIQNNEEIA